MRSVAAVCLSVALPHGVTAARTAASPLADLTAGTAHLMSAGSLTFGPDGVLFVGDSVGGSVVALDTNDRTVAAAAPKVNVQGIDEKIGALVGVAAGQIMINDIAVNPISKNVYLSASRGRGPDALPLIIRLDAAGKLTNVSLDNVKHDSVSLVDAPGSAADRQNPRTQTITDMAYVNGNLMVAGMSNEEWSSALRSIPFPFKSAAKGTQLQIWHASHGRFETQAPVRTFVPYMLGGQPYVLAAYTCTPLVKIPMSDLKPGAQVKGVTIADLGSGNQPLDMVPYKKDGHEYILIANSSFGVVKLHADSLATDKPIDSPTVVNNAAGATYDKITTLTNIQHLAPVDEGHALVVSKAPVSVQTIALP